MTTTTPCMLSLPYPAAAAAAAAAAPCYYKPNLLAAVAATTATSIRNAAAAAAAASKLDQTTTSSISQRFGPLPPGLPGLNLNFQIFRFSKLSNIKFSKIINFQEI